MTQSFRSNGKLLLTAEYLVLDGAKALAVPTKLGQSLTVNTSKQEPSDIYWKALDIAGNAWLEARLDKKTIDSDNNPKELDMLTAAFKHIALKRPDLLWNDNSHRLQFTSKLEFPRDWGLGSSSTFISNLAQWAEIDALELHFAISNGSGYDVAAASIDTPIYYEINDKKPIVTKADFNPVFADQLHFIHLNQKQQSSLEINNYRSRRNQIDVMACVAEVNDYTEQSCNCTNIDDFGRLMNAHEALLSKVLDTPTVKSKLFADYPFAIKSLGAWGGDFIMAVGSSDEMNYFKSRGFETIISYNDMVINNSH